MRINISAQSCASVPPRAGVDLDIGVVGVRLARQQALDLAPLRLLGQCAQRRHAVRDHRRIAIGLGHGSISSSVSETSCSSVRTPVHLRGQLVPLAHHLLRGGGIIPELRILGARVQFGEAALGDIPVKDASSAVRSTA